MEGQAISSGSEANSPQRSQHTPGPWRSYLYGDSTRHIIDNAPLGATGSKLNEIAVVKADRPMSVNAANARLIAAAPDLLDALIEFVQCNDGEHTLDMYRRARAAIAKAEGGAA